MTNVYIQHLTRTDLLFAEACKRCEAFVGERLDDTSCTGCPVLRMAIRHMKAQTEIAELVYENENLKYPDF